MSAVTVSTGRMQGGMSKGSKPSGVSFKVYKAVFCDFYACGRCSRGSRCTFAHHASELRSYPDLTKRKICEAWRSGGGCKLSSEACKFAHGEEEIRMGGNSRNSNRKKKEGKENDRGVDGGMGRGGERKGKEERREWKQKEEEGECEEGGGRTREKIVRANNKQAMCSMYLKSSKCMYGDTCQYAHSLDELCPNPALFSIFPSPPSTITFPMPPTTLTSPAFTTASTIRLASKSLIPHNQRLGSIRAPPTALFPKCPPPPFTGPATSLTSSGPSSSSGGLPPLPPTAPNSPLAPKSFGVSTSPVPSLLLAAPTPPPPTHTSTAVCEQNPEEEEGSSVKNGDFYPTAEEGEKEDLYSVCKNSKCCQKYRRCQVQEWGWSALQKENRKTCEHGGKGEEEKTYSECINTRCNNSASSTSTNITNRSTTTNSDDRSSFSITSGDDRSSCSITNTSWTDGSTRNYRITSTATSNDSSNKQIQYENNSINFRIPSQGPIFQTSSYPSNSCLPPASPPAPFSLTCFSCNAPSPNDLPLPSPPCLSSYSAPSPPRAQPPAPPPCHCVTSGTLWEPNEKNGGHVEGFSGGATDMRELSDERNPKLWIERCDNNSTVPSSPVVASSPATPRQTPPSAFLENWNMHHQHTNSHDAPDTYATYMTISRSDSIYYYNNYNNSNYINYYGVNNIATDITNPEFSQQKDCMCTPYFSSTFALPRTGRSGKEEGWRDFYTPLEEGVVDLLKNYNRTYFETIQWLTLNFESDVIASWVLGSQLSTTQYED